MTEVTNLRGVDDGEAATPRNTIRVTVPHGGRGTHTLMFAVEIDDDTLHLDDGLVDLLVERFRDEAERVITHYREQGELEAFLQQCRFSLADLQAYDARRAVSAARQELAWRLRQCGWSYPKIGRLLNRDHTTAMHAVRAHEAERKIAETRDRWGVSA